MRSILLAGLVVALLCALVGGIKPTAAAADETRGKATAEAAKSAILRGVGFVQDDMTRWKAAQQCMNCHHGAMTLWALNEAKRQGYAVDTTLLAQVEQGTKARFLVELDHPRDPRPGYNMIRLGALYLSVMARHQPDLTTVSPDLQKQIADHASRHLEEDGSVLTPATMTPPLIQNGPPPVFESREVLTLFALLAMQPEAPAQGDSPIRTAFKKSKDWLAAVTPGTDIQSKALRLLLAVQEGKSKRDIRVAVAGILAAQNSDGGWGQTPQLASDAYATGQTLYILSLAGVDRRKSEIQRGVSFLVSNQRPDGSWPMISRAHPGATPFKNPVPITHMGSCWAVLGLTKSVPATKAVASRE